MLSEEFSSLARKCGPTIPYGLDVAMHFLAYSILVTAMVVVLVECGYALYHLLLLV